MPLTRSASWGESVSSSSAARLAELATLAATLAPLWTCWSNTSCTCEVIVEADSGALRWPESVLAPREASWGETLGETFLPCVVALDP